jgi:DNA-binding MarR family transcriptional regulator
MSEFKYLDFADTLDQVRTDYAVNPTEWRALRTITKAFLHDHSLKTVDLMHMAEIASPATLHKIIKNLIAKDLVVIKQDAPDGRLKFLVPTPKTLKIFRSLASKM